MQHHLNAELARARHAEHAAAARGRSGIRRSARLISLDIRRQRRAGHR